MRKQSPIAVFLLSLITFGIYSIFWLARTRGEMVRKGADIPTTWLIIIPLVNYWYFWKWSVGVNTVTKKLDAILVFVLILLLGAIGFAIVQDSFNSVGEEATAPAPTPVDVAVASDAPEATPAPEAPSTPEVSPTTETPTAPEVAEETTPPQQSQPPQPPVQL